MQPAGQAESGGVWRWAAAVTLATLTPWVGHAQITCMAHPSADAFVRVWAPANNYGAAGSLSVSGSQAVNGSGQTNGPSDSLMRFSMSEVATSMNDAYGSNGWRVAGVTLAVNEVATPNNPIFNRGVGAFEIRWIVANGWVEGSGTPNMPAGDGVAYADLSGLLHPGLDTSLGIFTNGGANGVVSFALALAPPLVSNIVAGTDVDLYLTAADPAVGFTFNSRNFVLSNAWPALQIVAVPNLTPRINSIARAGSNQVAIRFNTASNWTYVLQGASGVSGSAWADLHTNAAQPFGSEAVFVESMTNASRFYRLRVSPP